LNVRDWLADKFSWSKLNTFAMCPRMAWYRYVLKRKMPPTLAILFGRGVHGGQEVDCYAKLRGEKLSTDQVLDAAVAEFEEDPSRLELDASVDDFAREHRTQLEKFEKSGERAKVVPVPGTVEAAFQLELDVLDSNGETRTPALVEGYVDVISEGEEGRAAVNYKAAQKPLSQAEANKHLQLTLEMIGAGVEHGRVASFIREGKQKAGSKVTRTSMGEEKKAKLLQFMADTIAAFRAALKTGDFPKCSPTAHYCSPEGCEFYRLCYPDKVEETTRFVQVTKILPAGSLPAAEWRESKAGRAERMKLEQQKKETA
jgi:CRISPR/Cas system-associated exonuclease Cas4 (RecB family)